MGGNIGLPILAQEPLPDSGVYVLELSSYQIDLTFSLDCDVAVLLNITPDHLDRHGTMQHYADVKERLVAGANTAIIGIDVSYCELIGDRVERAGTKVIRISKRQPLADGLYAEGSRIMRAEQGATALLVDLDGIQTLRGSHNAQNACAAIAACLAAGVSEDEIRQGLMFRESMPMSAGMLFVYEEPRRASFWMKNTLISLDMIFADATGTVRRVHEGAVPGDLTPIPGGADILFVL